MYNGNISQSLDRNHSLSLFYSRRTPSKPKPQKKQSKFILPSGENLSPAKINTTTPYNSTTTPILVHSLSDMSLKNDSDRLEPDDSPTPAGRYSKIKTSTRKHNKNNINSLENPLPLYPNVKSNSTSKIEGQQNMLTLPKFQRRSARMAVVMSERKPVNLFTNMSQEEKDELNDTPLGSKNGGSYNDKNQMNLDEQNTDLDDCPCSKGFVNSDGIWEDPTLSQSESRCLQTQTIGNIMITNEDYESLQDQNNNNDKTLMWDFEDENKFNDDENKMNDKENIIPDDYKGGVLAEREWCDLNNDEDSMMEDYDNNDYLESSSQNKSLSKSLQKGKKQSNSMMKKSEYQHVRYAFQEISVNSMPEYQMNSMDCYSVYSNSSFGSACDSQFMATPKKCSGSFKMNNSFSNSFNNDNFDNNDAPSFFNTLPLKTMKANAASSSNSKKSTYTKRLVYQLCGVPDMNAVHKRSVTKTKGINNNEKKGQEGNNSSFMNSSPIISKTSILSPPFLLSSPVVRNGFSSPLVQSTANYSIYPPKSKKPFLGERQDNDPFAKNDTMNTSLPENLLDDKTPKPRKVKSLLTTSINNSLSSSNGSDSPTLHKQQHHTPQIFDAKTTPKPSSQSSEKPQTNENEETVFFPHYHSRQHSQVNDEKSTEEDKQSIDETLLNQTSSMMSISPSTLSKINETHKSFLQLNQKLDLVAQESSNDTSLNLPKRGRISVDDKKKEILNRRRSRIRKYVV